MIIDFHTHTFPDKMAEKTLELLSGYSQTGYFSDGRQEGLIGHMRAAGIDYAVTLPVATKKSQVPKLNDGVIGSVSDFLIPFGAMHPDYEDWKSELKRLAAAGIRGIKIHPPYQNVDIFDERYLRIIDLAAELDLIVLTHAGYDIGLPGAHQSTVEAILKMLKLISYEKIVLAHMGGWAQWEAVRKYLCKAPVYMDTAFSIGEIDWKPGAQNPHPVDDNMTMGAFVDIVRAHGANRVLFATDSPWSAQEKYVSLIRDDSVLTEEEKNMIMGENAQKLLNLPI